MKLQSILELCRRAVSVGVAANSALTWASVNDKPLVTPEMTTESTETVTTLVVSTSYSDRLPVAVRGELVSVKRAALTVVSMVPAAPAVGSYVTSVVGAVATTAALCRNSP